ncbi:MAG: YCF48-related protein [bacterium]
MSRKKLLLPSILILALLLSGCISFGSNSTATAPIPEDGGFYELGKNSDGDYIWSQNAYLATVSSQKPNFKNADVLAMAKDPQDGSAIYLGTKENGMYYTYDGGKNWFTVEKFKKNRINDIAVSYKNKCLIYIAVGSELYKSEDCNRTWTRMYSEDREGYYISALAVDSYNEGTIYAGLSIDTQNQKKAKDASDVIKSVDFAKSWQVAARTSAGSMISEILINPKNTRIVYAATHNSGLLKTIDGGISWKDITGAAQEFPGKNSKEEFIQRFEQLIDFATDVKSTKQIRESLIFRDMEMIPDKEDSLMHASNYGILKSDDGGNTWKQIKLIPPKGEKKAIIYSLAFNPEKGDEFYYGTDDTLFRTTDGGENWTTIKGPGTRAVYQIIVTPNIGKEPNVCIGMYNLKPPAPKK